MDEKTARDFHEAREKNMDAVESHWNRDERLEPSRRRQSVQKLIVELRHVLGDQNIDAVQPRWNGGGLMREIWVPNTCGEPPCIIETRLARGDLEVVKFAQRCDKHHVRGDQRPDRERFEEIREEVRRRP